MSALPTEAQVLANYFAGVFDDPDITAEFLEYQGYNENTPISWQTFEEERLLTKDQGVTIQIGNKKFRVTVVQVG